MDIKKEVYATGNKWTGKVTTTPSDIESSLFNKYAEPTISAGGSFTDGVTSFTLDASTKKVSTDSPISYVFDPTVLAISLDLAGKRAVVFVDNITDRIEVAMDTIRATDSTSSELIRYKVV